MKHMWSVVVVKEVGIPDRCEYHVIADTIIGAIEKAVTTACRDSGYKTSYKCIRIERSETRVI